MRAGLRSVRSSLGLRLLIPLFLLVGGALGAGMSAGLLTGTATGALGYVAAFEEIMDQCAAAGVQPHAIVVTSSSGGTHAGLVAGRARRVRRVRDRPLRIRLQHRFHHDLFGQGTVAQDHVGEAAHRGVVAIEERAELGVSVGRLPVH